MFENVSLSQVTYLLELIQSGQISGWWNAPRGGHMLQEFERAFADYVGVKYAVAVSSGTAAIYSALKAVGVRDGYVAVTPYTHIGSVAPIILAGAQPLWTDVDERGNMDAQSLKTWLKAEKTSSLIRAVVIPHQLGNPSDMRGILEVASTLMVPVIEDASQSLGAKYLGKNVGSIGALGCFSIGGDMTKTISVGEGGMITTNDDNLVEICRMQRNHGEKVGAGYPCFNFRLSEVQAYLGLIQMPHVQNQIDHQIKMAKYLIRYLPPYLSPPVPDPASTPAHYIIGCHFNPEKVGMTRNEFLRVVDDGGFRGGQPRKNIGPGYKDLIYDLPFYQTKKLTCPRAEMLKENAVWIDWHRWPTAEPQINDLLDFLEGIPGEKEK